MAESLVVSQPEVCAGTDMVTFTLPTPDPSETVTNVVWSIEMGNGDAASYDLNAATGPGAALADWNGSSYLEFTPLNVGEFAVEATVTYASSFHTWVQRKRFSAMWRGTGPTDFHVEQPLAV